MAISRRRAGRVGKAEGEEGEISLTPMLDVVFILLIFFIVSTSFVKEPGIDPERPVAATAAAKIRGNILIGVTSADIVWMHKRRVGLEDVRRLVEAAVAENPESSVVVVADRRASTGMVIDVMDRARAAGVANIAVSAEQEV